MSKTVFVLLKVQIQYYFTALIPSQIRQYSYVVRVIFYKEMQENRLISIRLI